MRVLVTGGAGFIGSHTVQALVDAGHAVLVSDSFITGRHANVPSDERVTIVHGDIREPLHVQRTVRRFAPEAIVHLAGAVSVPLSLRRPLYANAVNVDGTLAVLEAARTNGVRRVVLASSAAVYGAGTTLPLHEDAPLHPLSPYALHKIVDEEYARLYADLHGLDTIALRYFNVYGPRQDPTSPYSGVIALFAAAALRGNAIHVNGDGTQTRDFVAVRDVAMATATAVDADTTGFHAVNVGTGRPISLLDLCSALETVLDQPLRVIHGPGRQGDIPHSCAGTDRLRTLLDITCDTSITDGLRSLVASLCTNQT